MTFVSFGTGCPTLSAFDATDAVARVDSFGPFVPSISYFFRYQSE